MLHIHSFIHHWSYVILTVDSVDGRHVSIKGWVYCKPLYLRIMTRQAVYVWRQIEAPSGGHFCCGRAMIVTQSECVSVALLIQHTKGMRRIIWSSVACLAVPFFSTLSQKGYDFRKNIFEHSVCVFWLYLQLLPLKFLFLRVIYPYAIVQSSCNVSVILLRFLMKLEFSGQTFKNPGAQNFIKISTMGAELFQAEIHNRHTWRS